MQFRRVIEKYITMNVDIKAIILLIDYACMMKKITLLDKQELLDLIEVETYLISEIIDYLPTIYAESIQSKQQVDITMINSILTVYKNKNVITQAKLDEIKTACGIS